jgi:hypothetical protein
MNVFELVRKHVRLRCITSVGRSSSVTRITPGIDNEDVEQLVYEAHLVFDLRLTREAMSSADHPHHLESLHCSRLHCLNASRGANDSLQWAVVGFNDVVLHLPRYGKCRPIAISFLPFLVISRTGPAA